MLLNIITRTCPHNTGLTKTILSVKNQSYENIRHIVIFDGTREQWSFHNFINFEKVEYFQAEREKNIYEGRCFFNLYLNDIRGKLKHGFILYLDDDDYLADKNVINKLMSYVDSEDKLYLFKMKWANGRVLPGVENFGKDPVKNDIGISCFMVHVKYMYEFNFDADRAADYRVLLQLFKLFPLERRKWLDMIVVNIGNTGRIK